MRWPARGDGFDLKVTVKTLSFATVTIKMAEQALIKFHAVVIYTILCTFNPWNQDTSQDTTASVPHT